MLVLMSGRPLDLRWAADNVPAILEAWYPGTQGGMAIANLLYGKAIPGGKLPFTWPRDVGQVPMFYAHTLSHQPQGQNTRYWNEDSRPLYPFGYGLSYSNFQIDNIQVSQPIVRLGNAVTVKVSVTNTGKVSADEVVQLYLHQQYGTSSRPVRELKGFQKVALAPQEKRQLTFTISSAERTYWSSVTRNWTEDPSVFDVWVGEDSDASLHSTFQVQR